MRGIEGRRLCGDSEVHQTAHVQRDGEPRGVQGTALAPPRIEHILKECGRADPPVYVVFSVLAREVFDGHVVTFVVAEDHASEHGIFVERDWEGDG